MTDILVVYYSSYGHIEIMANAQAEGARRVAGAQVTVKRVPELVPPEIAKASGFRLDQPAPIAVAEELERYDAVPYGASCVTGAGAELRMPSSS
jgi:NAD(P)H dehydrogenase (quinone)